MASINSDAVSLEGSRRGAASRRSTTQQPGRPQGSSAMSSLFDLASLLRPRQHLPLYRQDDIFSIAQRLSMASGAQTEPLSQTQAQGEARGSRWLPFSSSGSFNPGAIPQLMAAAATAAASPGAFPHSLPQQTPPLPPEPAVNSASNFPSSIPEVHRGHAPEATVPLAQLLSSSETVSARRSLSLPLENDDDVAPSPGQAVHSGARDGSQGGHSPLDPPAPGSSGPFRASEGLPGGGPSSNNEVVVDVHSIDGTSTNREAGDSPYSQYQPRQRQPHQDQPHQRQPHEHQPHEQQPLVQEGEGVVASPPQGQTQGQRYDLSHAARWLEQGMPFCLLVALVFVREHLLGFLTFVWLTTILVRSNDIIRRQAALKGERNLLQLGGVAALLVCHVAALLWLFNRRELLLPLTLQALKRSPAFWNAVFIVFVNDNIVRFLGMAVKCCLLGAFSLLRNRNFRRQAQILTFAEYTLLFVRGLITAPVWYRYFLNEKLGHLFSSLITGLYLTFKLSSVLDRFILFGTSLRQVVRREVQYGSHSTPEEVMKAGEMCAICHDKMLSPITLRCQHVFCEDCVSEWFEREQTCPMCRTVVRAPTLKSFADASTTLSMQIF